MSDIFISYKREDRATAGKLADALKNEGWTVWWDPELRAGEHFDDVIEKALNEAKCVIVLWSKLAVNSEYIKAEATEALEQKKLFPVKIDNVDPPFRFKVVHTPSLFDWDGSLASPDFRKFVGDISAFLGDYRETTKRAELHEADRRRIRHEVPNPWRKYGPIGIAVTVLLIIFSFGIWWPTKQETPLMKQEARIKEAPVAKPESPPKETVPSVPEKKPEGQREIPSQLPAVNVPQTGDRAHTPQKKPEPQKEALKEPPMFQSESLPKEAAEKKPVRQPLPIQREKRIATTPREKAEAQKEVASTATVTVHKQEKPIATQPKATMTCIPNWPIAHPGETLTVRVWIDRSPDAKDINWEKPSVGTIQGTNPAKWFFPKNEPTSPDRLVIYPEALATAQAFVKDKTLGKVECQLRVYFVPAPKRSKSILRGRTFLVDAEKEPEGYGLYTYILFGSRPRDDTERERYLKVLESYLLVVRPIEQIEHYRKKDEVNITLLPLLKEPVVLVKNLTEPKEARELAIKLLDIYNYARAQAILADFGASTNSSGPYLISNIGPKPWRGSVVSRHEPGLSESSAALDRNISSPGYPGVIVDGSNFADAAP